MLNFFAQIFAGIALSVQTLLGIPPVTAPSQQSVPTPVVHTQKQISTGSTARTTQTNTQITQQATLKGSVATTSTSSAVTTTSLASTTPPVGAYINTLYHFWMQFPQGWKNDGNGLVYPTITYWSPDKFASIRIWIGDPYSAGTPVATLKATADAKLSQMKKDLPSFMSAISTSTTVNGEVAWVLAGTWVDQNGAQDSTVILMIYHDGRVFELTGTSFSSTLNAYSSSMGIAIRSLTFTD
jgi:hypothetical protein